ncbi:MAG TPA: hypothetical protein VGH03_22550 [Caulobacteraceae bacterium]|jgi:hypothetical protein
MRLFHFSEDPKVTCFTPRPVLEPSPRPPGREWLNGALVWAIEEGRQAMYLFPRDCPRILLWPTDATTAEDQARFWQGSASRMIAYVEETWLDAIARATICRYDLPPETFESLDDAGMWVSRAAVTPIRMEIISELPRVLEGQGVELRAMPSLAPLAGVWSTTLHASGIRLRNARDWPGA